MGKLDNKHICILLEFNYEDLEVHYPLIRLQEEGAKVTLVAPKVQKYTGKHGYPAFADKSIDEVSSKDFDALIIPGGWAPDYWRRDERFVKLVQEMHQQGKPVAAICHGPWLLCSARIIKGVRVTSFCSIKDDVINAGGIFEDKPVVVDKGIITSRTPKDLTPFCHAIITELVK